MDSDFADDNYFIKELLHRYEGLRLGYEKTFLEEEDFHVLCDYFEEQENLNKAIEILTLGIDNYAYSADLKIRKADILISLHKDEEADLLLNSAFILDRLNPDYYLLKFELAVKNKKLNNAEQSFFNCLELFDVEDQVNLLQEAAQILIEHFEHEKIVSFLFHILHRDKKNEFALTEFPFWAQVTNRVEESIDLHKTLAQEQPYNHLIWFNLGVGYQSLGLYDKAIESYELCIAIDEEAELAIRNVASVLLGKEQFAKALEHLETLTNILDRPDSTVYGMLALCYIGMKNVDLAIKNYKTAISLDDKNSDLHFLLSKILYYEKRYVEAADSCKKALAINSSNPFFNEHLGNIYFAQEQYKNAANCFFKTLIVKKKNTTLWCQYLSCFILSGQYKDGFEKAVLAHAFTKKTVFLFFQSGFLLLKKDLSQAQYMFDIAFKEDTKSLRRVVKFFPELKQHEWAKAVLKPQKKK